MELPQFLSGLRYPKLATLIAVGLGFVGVAGILALAVDSPVLTFRVGVIGYLLVLLGGAGYIALSVARALDDMGPQ